ncbi:hypothetical protein D9M70_604110 [compost metagenome]
MVQRLGKTRISNGCRKPCGTQLISGAQAFLQARSEGKQCNLGAFTNNAALADFKCRAAFRQFDADTIATRIAERDRPFIVVCSRAHHMAQFGLVRRSHHHETR